MAYVVTGMKLIPQLLDMSCWYASAQMLINWKMEQRLQSIMGLIPPELDAECRKLRDDNNGVQNPQIVPMAKRLGLKAIPPMSPSPGLLEDWLKQYGPLWVNGKTHITVIAGIMWLPVLEYQVLVYDPSPVNTGSVGWRSLRDWYAMGNDVDSRDTGNGVETVFLYVPDTF